MGVRELQLTIMHICSVWTNLYILNKTHRRNYWGIQLCLSFTGTVTTLSQFHGSSHIFSNNKCYKTPITLRSCYIDKLPLLKLDSHLLNSSHVHFLWHRLHWATLILTHTSCRMWRWARINLNTLATDKVDNNEQLVRCYIYSK